MSERYINPFTDFGFKKLFGEEANKELLLDFLNEIIRERGRITSLTFLKNEHLGASAQDRKAIFDLYCESERGEKFIVELQKVHQKFFKERSLYYSTFALQEQAKTGDWDFALQPVYTIGILDFELHEHIADEGFLSDVWLVDRAKNNRVFSDKLRYIYLEMPKFNKTEEELETHFDKWMYVLKNLARLQDMPAKLQEKVFQHLFQAAEIARYSPSERQSYHDSLKYYRDLKNSLDTAREEGFEEGFGEGVQKGLEEGIQKGLEEGIQKGLEQGIQKGLQEGLRKGVYQSARLLHAGGMPPEQVAQLLGLDARELQLLRAGSL